MCDDATVCIRERDDLSRCAAEVVLGKTPHTLLELMFPKKDYNKNKGKQLKVSIQGHCTERPMARMKRSANVLVCCPCLNAHLLHRTDPFRCAVDRSDFFASLRLGCAVGGSRVSAKRPPYEVAKPRALPVIGS